MFDANWHFTEAVADGIKLQRIVLRTSDILLVFAALPLLRERGSFSIKLPKATGTSTSYQPSVSEFLSRKP